MNPKGEEGEFYMKKSLLVLASIMILALCTFVACTAEVSDPYDGLTYVTFGGESPASRNLLASYEVASYDELYWSYSAKKLDNYGTSGAATNASIFEDSTTKGLNKTVGPFSQGKWEFTLYAYTSGETRDENTKVYEGSVEVSIKGQKVTVPVSVTPYGETGALKFSGAYFAWKDNGKDAPVIEIVAKGTKTGQKYTLGNKIDNDNTTPEDAKIKLDITSAGDNKTYNIIDCEYSKVKADYYNCTIIAYIDIDGSKTPVSSQTFGFRVYGSTTTTISGDITEGEFTGVDFSVENMAVIEMPESSTASLSVTPSGMEDKTTDVDFSNAGLSGKHVLVVDVDSAVEASNFKIEGVDSASQSIVAGIGLELSSVEATTQTPVTNFGVGNVIVTTYIAKGLENVTVKYNGTNGGDPTNVQYYPSTGELTFTTTHFSEFYVVADKIQAINSCTNMASKLFVDAVDECRDNETIVLLEDTLVYNVEISTPIAENPKNVIIDLNNHAITGVAGNASPVFVINNTNVHFTGKGSIIGSEQYKTKGLVSLNSWGSVEIDSEISLIGYSYGILIDKYRGYGNYVRFNGSIEILDEGGIGITVNGDNKNTSESAPILNLSGAKINVSGGVGVYAAGYANWNISGNTEIIGYNTAIEIRAGNMTIDGGTFKSTATAYSCNKNDGGATTTGAAIAVAQHNTKLPIDVEIKETPTFNGIYDLSVTNPQGNAKVSISDVKVAINDSIENIYVSTDFIRDVNVIRAKTTEEDSKYVVCLSDGQNFTTLQASIDSVKENGTGYITLLQDVVNGDGILIPEGNKTITIDFNGKKYTAFEENSSGNSKKRNAFEFRKGNTINLKNGKLTSLQKLNVILIKNYSNLTLENFFIEGYRNTAEDPLFAASALTCCYGDTTITGESIILGKSGSDHAYKALDVCYSYSDEYKNGLTVTFDTSFSGTVSGAVYFRTENSHEFETGLKYNHSLSVDSLKKESFVNANFLLQDVRLNCSFNMDEGLAKKSLKSQAPTKVSDGRIVFDKDGCSVCNKTTDMVYTDDLRQAVFNAEDEDELILLRTCVLMGYPVEVNSKKITIDLNGEKVEAGKEFNGTEGLIEVDGGTLIVNDSCPKGVNGLIDATTNENVEFAIYAVEDATIYINDGTIKGNVIAVGRDDGTSKITINGGSFSSDPKDYLADGLNATLNGGLWIVSKN